MSDFSAKVSIDDAAYNQSVAVTSSSGVTSEMTVDSASRGTVHEIKSNVDVYYLGARTTCTATTSCPVHLAGDPPLFMPAMEFWAFLRVSVDGTAWVNTVKQA